jgi:aminotransferase
LVSSFNPADRLKQIKPSGIRRFFNLTKETPGIINLSVGEPDFAPPKHALTAGWKATKKGETHYTPTNGIPELREAIAQKVYRDYGLRYDPDTEILVTVGGTEAIFLAMLSLVNPGDEVLIPNPGFVCYEPSVLLAGGVPVSMPLLEERDFKPSVGDVMSRTTEKSRVMLLNYPNNPTGSILSHEEAAELAKVAVKRDMIVISDDVYEKILYDGERHHCFASFSGMRERTLVVNSFSKTYAMTGLRVGFVLGPKRLVSALWTAHQYVAACVDSLAQHIALGALNGPQGFVGRMVKEFDRRRHLVYERLNEIDGFHFALPKGAFYAFPNISESGVSSEKLAEFLVKEARVAVVPGSAFGSYGEDHIRVSYAAAYELLEEALSRMEKAVRKLKRTP